MVSGQLSGTPIPLPSHNGSISLGITTNQNKTILIEDLQLGFNETEIRLQIEEKPQTFAWYAISPDGPAKISVSEKIAKEKENMPREEGKNVFAYNHIFPNAFIISNPPKIKKQYVKLYVFRYSVNQNVNSFSLLLKIKTKYDEYELKPPFDMFPNIKNYQSEVLNFKIDPDLSLDKNQRLARYGFPHPPGTTIIVGKTL
jgi:hypothetical protein